MAPYEYQHRSLQDASRQIRLLKVFPSRDKDALLKTSISTYNLPDADGPKREMLQAHVALPPYFAISYVCGFGDELIKSHQILIDEKPFPVTRKVYSAIRIIRYSLSMPIHLWIDCISISQTDNREKSQQILLLDRIYNLSMLVSVWLGSPTPETEKALRFVTSLVHGTTFLKVSDAFIEQYSLNSVQNTTRGRFDTVREGVLRTGYATIMNSAMRLAWVGNVLDDVSSGESSSSKPFVESELRYQHQYHQEGRFFKNIQQRRERRAEISDRRQHYERVDAMSRKSSKTQHLPFQPADKSGFWNQVKTTYQLGVQKSKQKTSSISAEHSEAASGANGSEASAYPSLRVGEYRNAKFQPPTPVDAGKRSAWQPNNTLLESLQPDELRDIVNIIEKSLIAGSNYFDRMWTMQEPCVGRTVAIIGETTQVEMKDFLKVVQHLKNTLSIDMPYTDEMNQLQWINAEWHAGARLPLRTLLYECRNRKCFDPRDKIYAILGLMCERRTILVQPDYDSTVAEVYANAAKFIIASDQSLDVICTHKPDGSTFELPSWCPDFQAFGTSKLLAPLTEASGRSMIYDASLSRLPQKLENPYMRPANWRELRVEGICLGRIRTLSEEATPDSNLKDMQSVWQRALLRGRDVSATELDLFDALSQLVCLLEKLLVRSRDSCKQIPDSETMELLRSSVGLIQQEGYSTELFQQYVSTLATGRKSVDARCDFQEILSIMSRACIGDEGGLAAMKTLYHALEAGLRSRKGFSLEDGIIIGACPAGARMDDEVYVLIGCNVPVVLRQLDDIGHYQLIGECYCHGFMDGEAMPRGYSGDRPIEGFILI